MTDLVCVYVCMLFVCVRACVCVCASLYHVCDLVINVLCYLLKLVSVAFLYDSLCFRYCKRVKLRYNQWFLWRAWLIVLSHKQGLGDSSVGHRTNGKWESITSDTHYMHWQSTFINHWFVFYCTCLFTIGVVSGWAGRWQPQWKIVLLSVHFKA